MDGYLCPPGDHVEAGEIPRVAAIRELQEEVGVTVMPADPEFSCVAVRKTSEGDTVAFEFVLRDKQYPYENTEPDMCSELVWVDAHKPNDDIIEDFKIILRRCIIGKETYLEVGF